MSRVRVESSTARKTTCAIGYSGWLGARNPRWLRADERSSRLRRRRISRSALDTIPTNSPWAAFQLDCLGAGRNRPLPSGDAARRFAKDRGSVGLRDDPAGGWNCAAASFNPFGQWRAPPLGC